MLQTSRCPSPALISAEQESGFGGKVQGTPQSVWGEPRQPPLPGHPCVSKGELGGKWEAYLSPHSPLTGEELTGARARGGAVAGLGRRSKAPSSPLSQGLVHQRSFWEAPQTSAQGPSSPGTSLVSQDGQNGRPYGTWAPPWLSSRARGRCDLVGVGCGHRQPPLPPSSCLVQQRAQAEISAPTPDQSWG